MRVSLVLLAGCALTSRSTPLELRYFAPPTRAVIGQHEATCASLRIGRVASSSLLRTRIVHRDSAVEVAPYETLRWTDDPDAYVRRAVARALFDDQPLEQAIDVTAPTLEVDVLGFEELRRGPARLGRVELRYQVFDDRHVIAHGTIDVERVAGPTIEAVVAAIGDALDAASADVASRVVSAICSR